MISRSDTPLPLLLQPKEFETRVQVIEKVPEMKTVTKTDYVKRLDERTETVMVPKTKVVMEEVERVDMVPHVREISKTRTETRHRWVISIYLCPTDSYL